MTATRAHSHPVPDTLIAYPASEVRGKLIPPGDKSITHRALLLAAIANGDSRIEGALSSDDCLATAAALRALGVEIERSGADRVTVKGVGLHGLRPAGAPLDMGNSGTSMRLLTGLLAAQPFDSTLIGDESLMQRPMDRVAKPLKSMGARIMTDRGRPPIRIRAVKKLRPIEYEMPIASAQVKSALLLAGLYAKGRTVVTEPAPTRDHTERMLEANGVPVNRKTKGKGGRIAIQGPLEELSPFELKVPGDFSSAAFFVIAGVLAARKRFAIERVGVNSTRTGLLDILESMGADVKLTKRDDSKAEPVANLSVRYRKLEGVTVPQGLVSRAIDELPVLFVAAAAARGTTIVRGAAELRVKESDRILVMSEGLRSLGVEIEDHEDGLTIHGRGELDGGSVNAHGDHRAAMSFAIASLCAREPIHIHGADRIATSYPGFLEDCRRVGLRLEWDGGP